MGKVLVVGASGVVGAATAERFLASDDREVITVSRRQPEIHADRRFEHRAVDLRDKAAAHEALAGIEDVEDVVYTALFEKPGVVEGWTEVDQMRTNLEMLQNVIEPVLESSPGLAHVSLLQGTKAYGVHLHPIKIPARESLPRDPHENFYFMQEDYLRELAEKRGFAWTVFRPMLIMGATLNAPMNMIPVIGAYAAICREEGLPFSFPGGGQWVFQSTDSRIVAGAIHWASTAEAARNEIFNITNGDVCEWHELWPAIAAAVGLEPGPDRPMKLSEFLPEHAATWERIVAKHGLRETTLAELLGESHHYSDFIFAHGIEAPPPALESDVKIRAAGFHEVVDSEEMLRYWLDLLVERKVIPPA